MDWLPLADVPWPVAVALFMPLYVRAWVRALRAIRDFRRDVDAPSAALYSAGGDTRRPTRQDLPQ